MTNAVGPDARPRPITNRSTASPSPVHSDAATATACRHRAGSGAAKPVIAADVASLRQVRPQQARPAAAEQQRLEDAVAAQQRGVVGVDRRRPWLDHRPVERHDDAESVHHEH